MTTLREAAPQILEALEPMQNNRDDTAIQRAITALRASLPCTYKCEAWPECACATLAQQDDPHPPSRHCMCDACKPAFEPTPGPEQEPVAMVENGTLVRSNLPSGYTGPLYTAPPRREWIGLTTQDIELLDWESWKWVHAIETRLREKNHG